MFVIDLSGTLSEKLRGCDATRVVRRPKGAQAGRRWGALEDTRSARRPYYCFTQNFYRFFLVDNPMLIAVERMSRNGPQP
jgi:hypothetical protein